jgi:hypothetical protein
MTMIPRLETRLSSYPYLLSAVLYAAAMHGRDAGALVQKAHRLINKISYKHEQLDRTAQCAWGTDWREYLGRDNDLFVCCILQVIVCADCGAADVAIELMEELDKKDAQFGHLRDFINHCLSGDE